MTSHRTCPQQAIARHANPWQSSLAHDTASTRSRQRSLSNLRRQAVALGLAAGLSAVISSWSDAVAQSDAPLQSVAAASQELFGESEREPPAPALRADDIERAIWSIEDHASAFGQIAAAENNKHAKATWLILEENYRAAAQTLDRLRRDRRILVAELPDGEEAMGRDSMVLIDGTLDGAWPAERLDRSRQVGGDDWPLISQLSSILLQQLGAFRSFDDWTWFKRHLRQSGSLQGPAESLDPALAAEHVRFAHIEDKYLLATIREESAPTRQIASLWRQRQATLASEAEDFVLHHAATFSATSAARFARSWREYAQSAKQAATAYAGITFTAPTDDAEGTATARETASARPDRLWPAFRGLIDAVPERIKARTPLAGEPAQTAAAAEAAAEQNTADTTAIAVPAAEGDSVAESAIPETRLSDPTAVESDAVEPGLTEPVVAQPAPAEPATAPPATEAPSEAEPVLSEAAPDKLEAESAGSEPEAAEAEATEPAATEVASVETPATGTAAVLEPAAPETNSDGPSAADQQALSELVQRAVEDEQAQAWRDSLNRETFQANGVTVPIRDETTRAEALALSKIESAIQPSAGTTRDVASADQAGQTPDGGGTVVKLQPLQPDSEAAPGAGQVRPGLEWLQDFVARHRDLIALLPVVALLALIVLVAAWLWRSARGRPEEPLILTTALEEDPYADAVAATAGATAAGPAQQQSGYYNPFGQARREDDLGERGHDWRPSGYQRADRRAAFEQAASRAASPSRSTPPPAAEPRTAASGKSAASATTTRSDRFARTDSDAADSDPYVRARSELERNHPTARAASKEDSGSQEAPRKAVPSSAIAVVKAAAKPQPDSAVSLEQTGDTESAAGPQDLITALRGGDARGFETLLEQLTGLSRRDVRELLRKAKPDELAIACRGIGLDQLAFASMVIMIRRRYLGEAEVPPHQLSSALAAFISTSPDEARRRLQSWSLDADFTPVDDQHDKGPAAGYSY